MRISIVTLMPDFVRSALSFGVIGQALNDGRWDLNLVNPREFTNDVHHTVDDRVFGGGDGMLMMAEPLACAIEKIRKESSNVKVIHLSPRGVKFTDAMARDWAKAGEPLVFIASRYAGADERFIKEFCDLEVSVGDFVVSGGDLPAALIVDAVLRHVPGVLGNQASSENDSFSNGLFESAQYTRPREWRGLEIPAVLVTGDPVLVEEWRFLESLQSTLEKRQDLIAELGFSRQRAISTKLQAIESRAGKELRAKHEDKPAAAARRQANEDLMSLVRAIAKPWEREMMKQDERREKSPDKSGTPRR
ncbi:tRNA (guanosine(37)-N1)-methyltransferase TrmD [soil metagenome]